MDDLSNVIDILNNLNIEIKKEEKEINNLEKTKV